jgi:hydrogenase large subunit
MSHITHFYHLAALDYLDVSTATAGIGGPSVVMSPWAPQHNDRWNIGDINPGSTGVRDILVGHYVQALQIRREAHIAATSVDGKHPIQNAQVPGGFTTKPSTINWASILTLMTSIRTFINTIYIPDVLAAALCFGSAGLLLPGSVAGIWPLAGQTNLFLEGYGCGRTLAYGMCPQPVAGGLQLMPGAWAQVGPPPGGAVLGSGLVVEALITEDVTSGFYDSPTGLHPSVGLTSPNMTGAGKYTWHKAPRYAGNPHEVGPLARMVAGWALAHPTTVTDSDIAPIPGDTLTVNGFGPYITIGIPLTYTIQSLVNTVLTIVQTALGLGGVPDPSLLFSTLGRHAARALECKYLADAIACHAVAPTPARLVPGPTAPGCTAGIPIINNVILDPNPNSEVYTYQVMPKSLKMGRGLTEAPRGALGHWMTTEFRRIVNYQCVVPSTWNACGRDAGGVAGPIEQSLQGNPTAVPPTLGVYTGHPGDAAATTPDEMVNRVLKATHPYDICIACSVHMMGTKGNTIAKFRMDTDGRITREEVPTEA